MKKLCAILLTALLALGLCLPVHAAGITPSFSVSAPWDEIPTGAVYLDLLVSDGDFPSRSAINLKAKYGFESDAEIYTYNEDGYRSLSFAILTLHCWPELTYYAYLHATAADYARYRVLFDKLGDAVYASEDPAYAYEVDEEFDFGTPEAAAAKALSAFLGQEWEYGATCESFFGGGSDNPGTVNPTYVKAAFVDKDGKILKITAPFKVKGMSGDVYLVVKGDRLVTLSAYERSVSSPSGRALLSFFLFIVAFSLALAMLIASLRLRSAQKNVGDWLPDFVLGPDRKQAAAELKAGRTKRDRRLLLLRRLLFFAVLLSAIALSFVIKVRRTENSFLQSSLFLLSVILSVPLIALFHECGHLLFGRLTGYRFLRLQVGSLVLKKENGRLRLRRERSGFTGFAGSAAMTPPDKPDGEVRLTPFFLGGVIVTALLTAASLAAAILLPPGYLRFTLSYFALISGYLTLNNAIPWTRWAITDAEKISAAKESPAAHDTMVKSLRLSVRLIGGERLKDLPPEMTHPAEAPYLTNGVEAIYGFLLWEKALDEQDLPRARELGRKLTEDDAALPPTTKALIRLTAIYCDLLLGDYTGNPADYLSQADRFCLTRMRYDPLLAAVKHADALLYRRDLNGAWQIRQFTENRPFEGLTPQWKSTALDLITLSEAQAKAWGLIL